MVFLCHAEHLFSIKTALKFFVYRWLLFLESFKDVLKMQNNNVDKNPINWYNLHGSLVAHQFSIMGGARVQAKAHSFYLTMSSLFAENAQNYWKKSSKIWMCVFCQIEPKTQNMYSYHGSLVAHPHPAKSKCPAKFVTRYHAGIIIITACKYKVSYVCQRGIKNLKLVVSPT